MRDLRKESLTRRFNNFYNKTLIKFSIKTSKQREYEKQKRKSIEILRNKDYSAKLIFNKLYYDAKEKLNEQDIFSRKINIERDILGGYDILEFIYDNSWIYNHSTLRESAIEVAKENGANVEKYLESIFKLSIPKLEKSRIYS